jgi:diguanylate cyclase
MIDIAVQTAASLRQQGSPVCIAVNVAAQDLMDTRLHDAIQRSLRRHRRQPHDLKLELTEGSVIADPIRATEVLQRLADAGIETAIDDFGTGHASLAYLSELPITAVKIDALFVRDACTNARHRSIIRSTIGLARELGLAVIAEGAEDEQTLGLLAAEGCETVQGYALYRPLSVDDLRIALHKRPPTVARSRHNGRSTDQHSHRAQ